MLRGLLFALLLVPSLASAQEEGIGTGIDLIENFLGATNIEAVTGHGRLSVGVSQDGELTVMSWPNPSYCDQLGYVNLNGIDARTMPRFGAPDGAGSFLGLLLDDGSVTWLNDRETWEVTTRYADDGANPESVHVASSLGLEVRVVDAVTPEPVGGADVLVRDVTVTATGTATVTHLLTYANLSPLPGTSRLPELPFTDWAFDGRNDFAALWDTEHDAVIHFHPEDERVFQILTDLLNGPAVDWGAIGDALQTEDPDVAALVAGLSSWSDGAYVGLTTYPPPDQHQIGFDETDFCGAAEELVMRGLGLRDIFEGLELPIDPDVLGALLCNEDAPPIAEAEGWTHEAEDAWADLADGELGGNGVAAGEVNEALRTPLAFSGDTARAQVVFSFGANAAAVRAGLEVDAEGVAAAADAALESFLADKRIPGEGDVARVARRSLINIRVGTDAATGAIVASIARQAPYGLDWPRDGAFFNVLLDASGQTELVTQRAALYDEWQRDEPVLPTFLVDPEPPENPDGTPSRTYPADAWEMNYFADGMPGGFFRFEIDNVGFSVWTMVAHSGWVDDPEAYLRTRWDSIRRGTELLVRWKDEETGLHYPAQEDDNAAYTQTLHGAVTTFGAIDLAARAARLLGEDMDAERWEARATELRDAILEHLYDAEEERFISEAPTGPQMMAAAQNPGSTPTGPTAWLVWPMHVLPWDDARVDRQLELDLAAVAPTIRYENAGGAYFMKNTVSLAVARRDDPEIGPMLQSLTERIARHTTSTDHFGEVMVTIGEGDDARASQRVSTPHLWEGALFYLTALALDDPAALLRYEEVLPASRVPPPAEPRDVSVGGGGCRATPGPSWPWAAGMLLAVAWLLRRRQDP